jgi:cell division protein FtsI/penicillin-binding protein 2
MAAIRRKSIVAVAGLVGLGFLGSGCSLFGSSGSQQKAGQEVTTTAGAPATTDPATAATSAAPTTDASTSDAATSPASGGSAPGAFASDGTTPLSDFPSLVPIADQLMNAKHTATTIDTKYQAAAAAALSSYANSGMVVIQPSTGHILAIAERGMSATQAELAPGSTFKVVTTEDLLRNGMTATSSMPCTQSVTGYPEVINDSPKLAKTGTDLTYAFTQSCNTAYVNELDKITQSPLSSESTTYFGLNQPWDLGIGLGPKKYGTETVNVAQIKGGPFAQEMFGQGPVSMSPLNMASVAATVAFGQFRQPVLVDTGQPRVTATPLNSGIDATLKKLMQLTVTEGTAASLKVVGNGIGGKTGTAEPGVGPNNSWMIAFQGDVAVACVVEGGNFGNDSAGPAIAKMFLQADAK